VHTAFTALFVALLILVLVAAVLSFAVMGIAQSRRRGRLARRAHKMGLRFSADDPFDVPGRYGRFAVIAGGHGPRAHNVTYGRIAGVPVRTFDFRYEVGHGTRRLTRRYDVVVFELDLDLPIVLMWHELDLHAAPLPTRRAQGRAGRWVCCGDRALATVLAGACHPFEQDAPSIQVDRRSLMLAMPAGLRRRRRAWRLDMAESVIQAIRHSLAPVGAGAEASPADPARPG